MELLDEVKLIAGTIPDSKRLLIESPEAGTVEIISRSFSTNDIKLISDQCQSRNLFLCIMATTKPQTRRNELIQKDFIEDVPMVSIYINRKP